MIGKYKVGEIMSQNVVVAEPNESIYICAKKMDLKKVGSLVIVDGDNQELKRDGQDNK